MDNNFENILNNMTKPDVPELKHEDMLPGMIMKAKGKTAVSFWWLIIPLYVIAAFVMKSFYMPGSSFISILHQATNSNSYITVLLFLVLPIILTIANVLTIKQLFFLYGSLKKEAFIKIIVVELLIILLSLLVIIIYFL
jgi:hypothetical protein